MNTPDKNQANQPRQPVLPLQDISDVREALRSSGWNEDMDQQVGNASWLMDCVSKKRRNAFEITEQLTQSVSALENGFALLKTMSEVTPALRAYTLEVLNSIKQAQLKSVAAVNDARHETASKVQDAKNVDRLQENLLLRDVYDKGTMGVHAPISVEFAKQRGMNSGGQMVVDPRNPNQHPFMHLLRNQMIAFGADITQVLKNQKKQPAAVGMYPLTREVPLYTTPPAPTGFFARFQSAPTPIQTGSRTESMPISAFKERGTNEPAYCIAYKVEGTDSEPYRDPATNRDGCVCSAFVVLPQSLAQRVYAHIQKNPKLIRKILAQIDPALMSEQQKYMPPEREIFIQPAVNPSQAYQKDANQRVTGVKNEYIKKM